MIINVSKCINKKKIKITSYLHLKQRANTNFEPGKKFASSYQKNNYYVLDKNLDQNIYIQKQSLKSINLGWDSKILNN